MLRFARNDGLKSYCHCEERQRRGNLLRLAHSLKHCIQAVVVERDSGDYNTSV